MSLLLCLMVRYRPTSSSRLPQSLEFLETKMLCMCRLSPAVHSLSILTTGKDGFASQLCASSFAISVHYATFGFLTLGT